MRFVPKWSGSPADVDLTAVRQVVGEYPVSLAVVFGSYASGDQNALSDLDVAVRFEDRVSRTQKLDLIPELTAKLQQTTGIDAVDLVDLDTVGPAVGYEALSRGTLLYGDQSTAVELESDFLLRALDFQPVKREWDSALAQRIAEGSFGRP